jgi:hypothetical protein
MKREDFCRNFAETPPNHPDNLGSPEGFLAFLANRVDSAIHAGSL